MRFLNMSQSFSELRHKDTHFLRNDQRNQEIFFIVIKLDYDLKVQLGQVSVSHNSTTVMRPLNPDYDLIGLKPDKAPHESYSLSGNHAELC